MKWLTVIFALLIVSGKVRAVPVMDTATGTNSALLVTVVPDDKDPNLYYFFPNHYELAKDPSTNKYLFAYFEKGAWYEAPTGYVNTIFEAAATPLLISKVQEIKKANPNAKFTSIPIAAASFGPAPQFSILISEIQCQSQGNEIGQQLACQWKVNSDDRRSFRNACRSGIPIQVLEYEFSFIGLISGKPQTFNFSVPVYFTSLNSGDYFFDSEGRPINN